MKVVFYKDQKKYTVDNVAIPNIEQLADIIREDETNELNLNDLQMYHFRITSTRGVFNDYEDFEEGLGKETQDGINWQKVTVN